jgi:hypothetical protein
MCFPRFPFSPAKNVGATFIVQTKTLEEEATIFDAKNSAQKKKQTDRSQYADPCKRRSQFEQMRSKQIRKINQKNMH